MDMSIKLEPESLRENKREMFDGMRAYHQSEICHTNNAITMLLSVAGVAGTAALAVLFPQNPPEHLPEMAWGLWLTVTALSLTIALSAHLKINSDHKGYERFGAEYVRTSQLLGFYEKIKIEGGETAVKTDTHVGQGKGYRKTQNIIWLFAGVLTVLTLLFAALSSGLKPKTQPGGLNQPVLHIASTTTHP